MHEWIWFPRARATRDEPYLKFVINKYIVYSIRTKFKWSFLMWFEFFLYGLVLSGTMRVYQHTGGRGSPLELPLWMQNQWVSILVSIYSISLFYFIAIGFVVDGFGGILNTISLVAGAVAGAAFIPHAVGNILFIFYPILAFFIQDIIVNGY